MKKVLILAYDFPPYVSVGALRPYSWYKYFNKENIYPIVITRQWENKYGNHLDYIAPGSSKSSITEASDFGTIIRTPYNPNFANRLMLKYGNNKYKLFRKLISAFFEIFQYILPIGTKVRLYFEAKKYLKDNSVDLILVTAEPFILFKYASSLSKKFKIPWIADYRDPWTKSKVRSPNLFLKCFNQFFERKFLKNVIHIVTVSEFFKEKITQVIKNKTITIISNGFDDENAKQANKIRQPSQNLNIAFTGSLYNWHPIKSFLSVIESINEVSNKIHLNFYGVNRESLIKQLLENHPNTSNNCSFKGKMQNNELMLELANNNLLLLFNDYAIMGTKIFDYIGVKRHILLCFEDDNEANILKKLYHPLFTFNESEKLLQKEAIIETNSGTIIKNSIELKEKLLEFINEMEESGRINCNSTNIDKYARSYKVITYGNLINKIIKSNPVL